MEYTLNELAEIKQEIQGILDKGTQEKYTNKLIYALRKNLKKIDNEIETVKEDFKDNAEGFNEYQKERFELIIECGAEAQLQPNGSRSISSTENLDQELLDEKIGELNEEYSDVIEEQEKVIEHNSEKANEKMIEIDWYDIRLGFFNDNLNSDEMPQALIDLIKE